LPKSWIFIFFKQNDDFSMIFAGFASKEKIKQNLGNHKKKHQKIIKKSSFCLKKPRKLAKILDFHSFSNKTMPRGSNDAQRTSLPAK